MRKKFMYYYANVQVVEKGSQFQRLIINPHLSALILNGGQVIKPAEISLW